MNILYLNNSVHLGGDTKCILKLCKELVSDHKIIVASKGGQMKADFEALGVKHYDIKDVSIKGLVNIFYNVRTLINLVKQERIEIIHSHHRMTTLIAKIVAKFVKVKVIHTQHLCIEDKFKLTHLSLKNISVVTVSEAAKRILVNKSNLDIEKIRTIYNTIELETSDSQIDEILLDLKQNNYFVVAQVSRVIHYKGVYDFVDVAEQTVAKNSNIRFVFIGDGPEFSQLKAYVKDKGLEEVVLLLGSKNNVIKQLECVDLVLLCSYIEGLPLVPIEAFSQKIPVIATNIDGTNEEITHGFNGYLVKTKDTKTFSEYILKLEKDKTLYEQLSENAYKTFSENFEVKQYVEKHLAVYEESV